MWEVRYGHRKHPFAESYTDSVKNSQGEVFADFVRGMNMVVVNGRKGSDAFTCISGSWLTTVWLGRKDGNGTRKVVPKSYLESEVGRVKELTEE